MFPPISRLRMRSIYGDLNSGMNPPVDFNGGMDINSLMADKFFRNQSAMNTGQDEKNYWASHSVSPEDRMAHLNQISQMLAQPDAGRSSTKPMDVVFKDTHPDITEGQKASLEIAKQKEGDKNLLSMAKLGQGQESIDIKKQDSATRQHRADIYDFKAKHPGMKIVSPPGSGQTFAIDPITGDSQEIKTDAFSNAEMAQLQGGIKSGLVAQEGNIKKDLQKTAGEQNLANIAARVAGQKDIQGVRGSQALEQIGKRGDIQKEIQNTRGTQADEQIDRRGNVQKDVNAAKPNRGELPTQTKVRRYNSAGELINTRPDLAPYIHIDSSGSFTIDAPSEGLFGHSGPTAAQYDEIKKSLYGDASSLDRSKNSTAAPSNNATIPDDRVVVEKDGKQFHLPRTQLEDAKKQGYKEVK